MTGFRASFRGIQGLSGVEPDLTCLGKVVGGGLPAAAYGGAAALMDRMAPDGPVYQAGTLSGNPLAMAAGIETLQRIAKPGVFDRLGALSKRLASGLSEAAADLGIELHTTSVGGMFGFFFHPGPVRSFADAKEADEAAFRRFFAGMIDRGIYLAPSPYEAGFVSLAHRPADIDVTLEAAHKALRRVAAGSR
jgi:glutamate-1-semialdehyde 2,1-aminomutase